MFVNERNFREFLKINRLEQNTINSYVSTLKNLTSWLEMRINNSILDITLPEDFRDILQEIKANPHFTAVNKIKHYALTSALSAYSQFLNEEADRNLFIPNNFNSYTKEDFLSEVFISEEKYNLLINLLERKKNIILQGAPGVGKTFAAIRLSAKKTKIKLSSCSFIKIILTKILLWVTSRPKIILSCGQVFSTTSAKKPKKIPIKNFSSLSTK